MRLQKINLQNFKGIKNLDIDFGGESCRIKAFHGKGKTTLADAYLWLFDPTGKGDGSLAVKPRDKKGQDIHDLETIVKAVVSNGNTNAEIGKKSEEKWVKRRGAADKEFTGNVATYSFNGLDMPRTEWVKKVESFLGVDLSTFQLLSSPGAFNRLHWAKKRDFLFSLVEDLSDQGIISSDDSLKELPSMAGEYSIEEFAKKVKQTKSQLAKKKADIPVRIDELSRNQQGANINPAGLEKAIREIQGKIDVLKSKNVAEKLRKEKREMESLLADKKADLARKDREEKDRLEFIVSSYGRKKAEAQENIVILGKKIEAVTARINELRKLYHEEQNRKYDGGDKCPFCKQDLPEEMVTDAEEKFKQQKLATLTAINTKGKEQARELQSMQILMSKSEEDIVKLEGDIKKSEILLAKLTTAEDPPEFKQLAEKIKKIEKEIENCGDGDIDTSDLEAELAEKRKALAVSQSYEQIMRRVEELKAEEKELASLYEQEEYKDNLIKQFNLSKIQLITDVVNSKFTLAKFELFAVLINGEIKETCVTLYDGAPYGAGLNTGMEMLVDVDIASTLQQYYGVNYPIWVDKAESCRYPVIGAFGPDKQIIMLEVSTEDELTVIKEMK